MNRLKFENKFPFFSLIIFVFTIGFGTVVQFKIFEAVANEIKVSSPQNTLVSESLKEANHVPFVKEGNIYVFLNGQTRQLTNLGVDYAPLLSPDETFLVFTRQNEILIEDDYGEIYKGEQLWAMDSTGQNKRLVLEKIPGILTWEKGIVFKDLMFSPDGKKVYFSVVAGNTHGLHVVSLDDLKHKFLMYGVGFDVIKKSVSEDLRKYEGHIINCQKRYSLEPGSYYMTYLYSPEGKEIDVVRGDCSGGYNWFEVMPHVNARREPVIPR